MLLVILYLPSRQEIMHNHDMYNGEHISKLTKSYIPTVNTAARSIVHKKMDDHALREKKKTLPFSYYLGTYTIMLF